MWENISEICFQRDLNSEFRVVLVEVHFSGSLSLKLCSVTFAERLSLTSSFSSSALRPITPIFNFNGQDLFPLFNSSCQSVLDSFATLMKIKFFYSILSHLMRKIQQVGTKMEKIKKVQTAHI